MEGNEFEGFEHAAFAFGGFDLLHGEAEFNIIADVEVGKEGVALEDLIHIAAIRGKGGDVRSVDKDLAFGRSIQTRDHAQGGGFSATRWPEESKKLAWLNF